MKITISFYQLLTAAFICMQITGAIHWHWFQLIMPLLIEWTDKPVADFIKVIQKNIADKKQRREDAEYQKAFEETGVSRARWQHEKEHPELARKHPKLK
jgi:hypothetical protein